MITESVYLEGEQTAEMKHEFLKGDVRAMVGASDAHVTMTKPKQAALFKATCLVRFY